MKTPDVRIQQAQQQDVAAVAVLFDLYRQFYHQPPDPKRCETFIQDRIANGESTIFIATEKVPGTLLGFTQLYPTFCSVAADSIYVLYDLFVAEQARGRGVGRMLMQKAADFAREQGASRIELQTHHTNLGAQHLYESLGYKKDEEFFSYALALA